MLLVEITINGTAHKVSDELLELESPYDPYIDSFTSPQHQMDKEYGGFVSLKFGTVTFMPTLFESDWPPPHKCTIIVKYTATTEASAITIFSGDAHLESFDAESVSYEIYGDIFTQKVLTEGVNYDGDTVPYPRGFGLVSHVEPVRVADVNNMPTYHLGGLATAATAVEVTSFTLASTGTMTKVTTKRAHGYSNGETTYLAGSLNFDGGHLINHVAATSFWIPVTFATTVSEGFPMAVAAYQAGDLVISEDGVPIPSNVIVNAGGTFSLTANPVGMITMSGGSSYTTLDAVMNWGKTRLGLGTLATSNSRSPSPAVAHWETSQKPVVDFLSDLCAFNTHLYYITFETKTMAVVDLFGTNTMATLDEFQFFGASYEAFSCVNAAESDWSVNVARDGRLAHVPSGQVRYIESVDYKHRESLYTVSSGTTSTANTNQLITSGATFVTDGVLVGYTAWNEDDDTSSVVTAVSQATLTLVDDIFTNGESYKVGPYMPYGDDESVDPFHTTRSYVAAALQNILKVLNKNIVTLSIPITATLPVPGKKFTATDNSLATATTAVVYVRDIVYNFGGDEIVVSGEGDIS